MREKVVEDYIRKYLTENNWDVQDRLGRCGIDIEATKDTRKAIIEVKGIGAHTTAMSNNFQSVFGQILKDMADDNAEYYVAFPKMDPYQRLWNALPALAKARTSINVIWVDEYGAVTGI